jgi:hypothetical protein
MPLDIPPEIRDAVPGASGAALSYFFTAGESRRRIVMAVGGAVMSYYAAKPAAVWMGSVDLVGLAGFVFGLFGMSIASKAYEGFAAINAAEIGGAITQWVRSKLGV